MRERNLEFYKNAIALNPDFELKGKNMLYTSANGYMFSQLNKAGELGIRLSKKQQDEFLATHESGPFLSYGAKMKDYVLVPSTVVEDTSLFAKYLKDSYEYVMSLPEKKGK